MPATVRISESARLGLRTVLIILAAVVLLVPIVVTTAHGASRLDYGRIETDEALPKAMKKLKMTLDNGAAVEIRTAEVDAPSVKLTATGPRDSSPGLKVRTGADAAEVAVDNRQKLENTQVTVTVPTAESADLELELDSNYGTFDVAGDFAGVTANTGGGALHVNGSADHVRTSTDWGATYLRGTFGAVESKTGVGALEGEDLTVRDRLEAMTSTGTLDLDFTNEAIPSGGIAAKTDEGSIELRLPNLALAQENMAAEAAADGGQKKEKPEEFFYRINAKSNDGSVDLAQDLDKYDVANDPKGAEGKTLVPVSATADAGMVTVNQN
ncbi:DUF4097 family beta strand repeat-containing protein [Brevibacterium renqingii]|uniref:DUF4097 family beta strand repeat-containing protein n=1 Tax=Brevibacterium renqingii TaxID=2776916 RepID=UPI001ADF901A|nr:DUF4097 family beta strand repeat-containing protein [Brevibacterium renqingii]